MIEATDFGHWGDTVRGYCALRNYKITDLQM